MALITTLFFSSITQALPNVTRTLTFQGRLLTSSGSVVADGHYNMQFKIYQGGSGTAAGNPDGSLKWTETYTNNGGTDGIEVKNGFFSIALGAVTPFGTSVDWDQDNLWLSMNIAGNAAGCSTFGTAPCVADGEMLPMKKITATPYSLNSGAVGGKTANELVQLGQGVQTDASNNSSIFINKTGVGNLVQLQAGGTDAFTLNNAGSITLGSSANQSLGVATSASGAGKSLTISAGTAASGSSQTGGDVVLQGGAGADSATSGNVIVKANGSNSTGTFQVQNADGDKLLNVDTINSVVSVGTINISSGGSGAGGELHTLWDEQAVTASSYDDAAPLNFGVTFRSDVDGYVTGVKFYNAALGNANGFDVGKLWACNSADCFTSSGGTELASVNFAADTSEGWKTARFATPVHISPNTFYVVTYYSTSGRYKASPAFFTTDHHNAPLHALKSSTTQNGSFNPSNSGFPTNTFNSTNYWVDVEFQASGSTSDQLSSSGDFIITSSGAMTVGPTTSSLTVQGSSIDIAATNGGNVTIQGGNATVSNGNGGTVTLSGGAGNGTGVSGLVVMTTPTFSTVTNDANCYTTGAVVASSCTLTASTVNNNSAAIIGFSATGQTATLPDPTLTTAGRILYVTAAGSSEPFTLKANVGGDAEQNITLRKNTTATLLWNGDDWTVAGGSNTTTLQDAYTNSAQTTAGSDIVVSNDGSNTGGLTVQNSTTNPVSGALLDVKNAAGENLLSVNTKVTDGTEHAADGGVNDSGSFSTNWTAAGGATVSRITSDGQESGDSAQVAAGTGADNGIRNALSIDPQLSTKYQVSVYAKLISGSAFTDFKVRYSPDNGSSFVDCANYNTQTITSGWTQITCEITTSATAVTTPYVYLVQPTAPGSARTFLVDSLSFTLASNNTPNVKVGSGTGSGDITLFTLDKSASAPVATSNDSLLGSMYYDTTLGKVQCFEAEGWGQCGASPDIFVTISPEYTNAVMNGTDIGTITSDLCSDTLNINDGSSGQPTICGTNETYNFYKWTSAESTNQTRSIYVTYQLPSTFKNFAAGLTSLKGRTSSADSSVSYQVYRDDGSSGLLSCGSSVSVSTGNQSTWQQAAASGSADPSNCGFEAGDSILFRINLTAKGNANAYVSNLSFVYSNN